MRSSALIRGGTFLLLFAIWSVAAANAADTQATIVERTMPDYPAAGSGREGSVVVRFTVGVDGHVHDAIVEFSDPPGLFDAAALAALATWRYKPKTVDGVAAEQAGTRVKLVFKQPPPAPKVDVLMREAPLYPRAALKRGLEGSVRLRLDVDAVGHPENIMVLNEVAGGALDRAAIQAVREATFQTPEVNGLPQPVDDVVVEIPFKLADAEVEPIKTYIQVPNYPGIARQNGVQGYCKISYTIADDGTVAEAHVVLCLPKGYFEASSLESVKKWRFQPPAAEASVKVRRQRIVQFPYHLYGLPHEGALKPGQWVKIAYTLTAEGDAVDLHVAAQSDPNVNVSQAMSQVRLTHFQPWMVDGKPVEHSNQVITIYGPSRD